MSKKIITIELTETEANQVAACIRLAKRNQKCNKR